MIAARQGEGIGRARLAVSTAAADPGNPRFYRLRGFRMPRIVRDTFGPATGYAEGLLAESIPLRDQVVRNLDP